MSNDSPLSQSFLWRAEAQLILKVRSLRSATVLAHGAPLTRRILGANCKKNYSIGVVEMLRNLFSLFMYLIEIVIVRILCNQQTFFFANSDKCFPVASLWSGSSLRKLPLMIRATLMMLTSSDLHVFLPRDSGPSVLICRRAAAQ